LQKINALFLRYQTLLWLPVVGYASLIFYLSSRPNISVFTNFIFLDKLLHLLEYAIFGVLLMRAFVNSGIRFREKEAFFFSSAFGFFYAISDEMHQIFVPGRVAAFSDLIFDFMGIILGIYLYALKKTAIRKN